MTHVSHAFHRISTAFLAVFHSLAHTCALESCLPLAPRITARRLVWVDRDGNVDPLPADALPFMRAELSPDGSLVALDVESARGDIWIYDTVRDVRTRLTFEWAQLAGGMASGRQANRVSHIAGTDN